MDTQTNMPAAPTVAQSSGFAFPKAGKILAQAQEIYKAKFNSLILIALCSVGVSAIAGFITGSGAAYLKSAAGSEQAAGWLLVVLVLLFIIYISIWSFAATVRNINSIEPNLSAGKSFSEASHDVSPLILTGLLAGLFILGGTILLVVPGIIFAFWYGQSAYVVIAEGLSGKKAMDQSRAYVKGNVGQIFKKGFYIAIISWLIAFIISLVFGTLDKVLHLSFLSTTVVLIFQLFWTPLASIYSFLLFQYLRQSKASASPVQ